MDRLKTLSELPGAAGREEHIRAFLTEQVKDHCDDITIDPMGNMICLKKGTKSDPKRVMIACHMDEIAFYVRFIDDDGFLRVIALGGFDTRNLFARRVRIEARDGTAYTGNMNPAGKPIHVASPEDRKKIPTVMEFAVDVGMSGEKAKEIFRPGDPVTLIQDFIDMGDLVSGKSMDNRIACWVGLRVLEEVKKPEDDLYVVFTVQEEIGVRGAISSSHTVNPDIGIALDVTLAVDIPGVAPDEAITRLGDGVAIKILDSGSVSDKGLVDAFIAVAEKHEIKHQFEILPLGGTDAAGMQKTRGGCKVITLSVPTRYVHTVTETVAKEDLFGTVDLLVKYLEGK